MVTDTFCNDFWCAYSFPSTNCLPFYYYFLFIQCKHHYTAVAFTVIGENKLFTEGIIISGHAAKHIYLLANDVFKSKQQLLTIGFHVACSNEKCGMFKLFLCLLCKLFGDFSIVFFRKCRKENLEIRGAHIKKQNCSRLFAQFFVYKFT